MHYVYLLRSINFPDQTYVGYTSTIEQRILKNINPGKW